LKKIAIISSHPIQYNAPLFALLAKEQEIELMVFYTWGEQSMGSKYDPDFGKTIEWDIPLLEGYPYTFAENISKDSGSHHFKGIINPNLNQEIENWGADVVWVWGWAFDSHLKAMRYFKGKIPVWFRGDSTLLDEPIGFSFKKLARRVFLTWVYKHVDKAFYVGTHNEKYFKKHGLTESQLVYAPHAIDNERFSDPTGEKSIEALKWREKLGFKKDDIVLLFAGKFEPRKNPFFLVELMKVIQSESIKLLVVGNGPLENNLKESFSKDQRVSFLDFQNQNIMPILYRIADYYVLPSISETWGLGINEALASGSKVIASKSCGGACDLINENNGIIFCPQNELKELQNFILENLKDYFSVESRTLISRHSYKEILQSVKSELKQ
jgi:glycosyltransferase involved in cell wall biosynthesis